MKFEDFLKDNKQDMESLEPTNAMWEGISEAIDQQDSPKKKSSSTGLIAIVAFLALVGVAVVSLFLLEQKEQRHHLQIAQLQLEQDISEIKGLLTETKTSSRLKAINKVGFIEKNDNPQLPEILLKTVKSDPSLPVKFAALNALEDYVELESVRIGLIEILSSSDDDKLKVRLMSFLSEINESRIEPFINDIMEDDERFEVWKNEAGKALDKIKEI